MAYKRAPYRRSFKKKSSYSNYRRPTSFRKGGRGTRKNNLSSLVQAQVKKALASPVAKQKRDISLRLVPIDATRSGGKAEASVLPNGEHPLKVFSEAGLKKYVLLPVTQVIPSQRPAMEDPHDSFRGHDDVYLRAVSLRLTVSHSVSLRLKACIFRNWARFGHEGALSASGLHMQPFEICTQGPDYKSLPNSVSYEMLSKDAMLGGKKISGLPQQLSLSNGPFATRIGPDGQAEFDASDGTPFTCRSSSRDGAPIGSAKITIDGVAHRKKFKMPSVNLPITSNLHAQGVAGPQTSYSRHRQIELFWTLNEKIHFRGSLQSSMYAPIEMFLGLDVPQTGAEIHNMGEVVGGAILGSDLKVYYSS